MGIAQVFVFLKVLSSWFYLNIRLRPFKRLMSFTPYIKLAANEENNQHQQNIEKDKVYIGATVLLKDLDENDEFNYTIVDVEEANPSQGKISVQSPMAQGILGHKAGEELKVKLPGGVMNVKILKISR